MDDVRDVFVEYWESCPRCGGASIYDGPDDPIETQIGEMHWAIWLEDYDPDDNYFDITEEELAKAHEHEDDWPMLRAGVDFSCPVCGWTRDITTQDKGADWDAPEKCPRCDGIDPHDIYYCDECNYVAFRNTKDRERYG